MTPRRGWIRTAAAVVLLGVGAGSTAAPPQVAPSHEAEMYEAIVTAEVWRCEHEVHEALARRDEERRQRGAIEELVEQLEQSTDAAEQEKIKRRIEIRSLSEFIAVQIWSQAISDARICVRQKAIAQALRGAGAEIEFLDEEGPEPPAESRTGDTGSGERGNHAI